MRLPSLPSLRPHLGAARLEIAALSLLAILPLLPYLDVLMRGVPRYTLLADFAFIEHDTRHVFSGETLLGLQGRFAWHHPGPLFFYFVAPFTSLFGKTSTGLYVGTWVLVALALGSLTAMTRMFTTRACAVALLGGIAAWFCAFGDIATNPWNRVVVVVPLLACVGFAALFGRGMTSAVYPLLFFGAIAAETHVSTVTTVSALGGAALVSFLVHSRRRRTIARDARHLWIAAALLLLAVAPMLVEEFFSAHEGNLTRLYHFMRDRQEPLRTYGEALKDWGLATSWLPGRILDRSMATEGPVPMMIRWDAVPTGLSRAAVTLTVIHVITAIGALLIAVRRRDLPSLAFLLAGALGEVVAINSLRAIVGEDHYSLVFWVAAPCAVTWIGVLSTLASWTGDRLAPLVAKAPWVRPLAVAAGILVMTKATADQAEWTRRNPKAPSSELELRPYLQTLVLDVEDRLRRDDEVPVIHMDGAWPLAAMAMLELEKDGFDVRYGADILGAFPGARSDAGVARPLHIWFQDGANRLPIAPCAEPISKARDYEAFVTPVDRRVCDNL